MRQAPFRPGNEISQSYNSGICGVFRMEDGAPAGYAPRPVLTCKVRLPYEEQRLGLTRYYAARQTDVQVERVIRVPRPPAALAPTPQDVVRTDNGLFYRVDLVQTISGVWPASLDLTLVRYEQDADLSAVSDSDTGGGDSR